MEPIKLQYGDLVRMEGWSHSCYATVFSVEGYARANGACPVIELARALDLGHDLVSFGYIGGALVHDPSGAYHARERARQAEALSIPEGAVVEIESRLYRVESRKGNAGPFPVNSDPIRFVSIPVEAA